MVDQIAQLKYVQSEQVQFREFAMSFTKLHLPNVSYQHNVPIQHPNKYCFHNMMAYLHLLPILQCQFEQLIPICSWKRSTWESVGIQGIGKINKEQQKSRMLYIHSSYYRNQQIMSKKGNNYLLEKTGLGEIKKGFHDLPPADHIYGKAPPKDKFGAREVIGNWELPVKSESKTGGKDYISMNREGLKNGCIDSKQITDFRKNNEIKVKVKEGQKVYGVSIPDEEFTYGIPNRPSTPIKNVICNTYAQEELKLKEEREAVHKLLEKDENKKAPLHTDLSPKTKQKQQQDRRKQIETNNFKLAKFKEVESKVAPMMGDKKTK